MSVSRASESGPTHPRAHFLRLERRLPGFRELAQTRVGERMADVELAPRPLQRKLLIGDGLELTARIDVIGPGHREAGCLPRLIDLERCGDERRSQLDRVEQVIEIAHTGRERE